MESIEISYKRLRSEYNVSLKKVKKIPLSTSDDERLYILSVIISHPYVIRLRRVYQTELSEYVKIKKKKYYIVTLTMS